MHRTLTWHSSWESNQVNKHPSSPWINVSNVYILTIKIFIGNCITSALKYSTSCIPCHKNVTLPHKLIESTTSKRHQALNANDNPQKPPFTLHITRYTSTIHPAGYPTYTFFTTYSDLDNTFYTTHSLNLPSDTAIVIWSFDSHSPLYGFFHAIAPSTDLSVSHNPCIRLPLTTSSQPITIHLCLTVIHRRFVKSFILYFHHYWHRLAQEKEEEAFVCVQLDLHIVRACRFDPYWVDHTVKGTQLHPLSGAQVSVGRC